MNRYESDDDLDRALFALDLEEPPQDLRAAILAGTIYRAPLAVRPWEVWAIGIVMAVAAWLVVSLLVGGASFSFGGTLDRIGEAVSQITRPEVLFWIAMGASATFWISQLNLTVAPGVARSVRR